MAGLIGDIFLVTLSTTLASSQPDRTLAWDTEDYMEALDANPNTPPEAFAPELFNFRVERGEFGTYNTFLTRTEGILAIVLTLAAFASPFLAAQLVVGAYGETRQIYLCRGEDGCDVPLAWIAGNFLLFLIGLTMASAFRRLMDMVVHRRKSRRDNYVDLWQRFQNRDRT